MRMCTPRVLVSYALCAAIIIVPSTALVPVLDVSEPGVSPLGDRPVTDPLSDVVRHSVGAGDGMVIRDAEPVAGLQTSEASRQKHWHHRHHSHHWHHRHHSHHWHHDHHRWHTHIPVAKGFKKLWEGIKDLAGALVDLHCDAKAVKAQALMAADPKPNPATTAPWSSLQRLNVAMFMAFLSYNNANECERLINTAGSNSGAVKAGGFKFGSFFSGKKSGVERLLATGKINGQDTVVVAYRGTESLKDIWHDMGVVQMGWPHGNRNGHVHSGMYRQFEDNLENCAGCDLKAQLRSLHAKGHRKFLTTGHSLGGAIAIFLARYIGELLPDSEVEVITFGAAASHSAGFKVRCSLACNGAEAER